MANQYKPGAIGVFDSGYGGLTVFKDIVSKLPAYDYIYLGDNARAPYGTRSLDLVYEFTLQSVEYLFSLGCNLVILACNTASANALRTIQQKDLERIGKGKRVLGVIRPTTERLSAPSKTKHLGVFATEGTVNSMSYVIEAEKYAPEVKLHQQACPMWVPLIENNELDNEAVEFFTRKYIEQLLQKDESIDSILLACTHYPILFDLIRDNLPEHINLISQGELVASSLEDYLIRNTWMDNVCSKSGQRAFLTTDSSIEFDKKASKFFGSTVRSKKVEITKKPR